MNRMIKIRAASFFVFMTLAFFSEAALALDSSTYIDLKHKLDQSGGKLNLKLSVKNVSDRSITMFKADLPWANRHSLVLVVVTNDSDIARLSENLFIDDPVPGDITIKPGGELSGTIDLSERFPGLSKKLIDKPVILFIHYKIKIRGEPSKQSVGAAIEIPRIGQDG